MAGSSLKTLTQIGRSLPALRHYVVDFQTSAPLLPSHIPLNLETLILGLNHPVASLEHWPPLRLRHVCLKHDLWNTTEVKSFNNFCRDFIQVAGKELRSLYFFGLQLEPGLQQDIWSLCPNWNFSIWQPGFYNVLELDVPDWPNIRTIRMGHIWSGSSGLKVKGVGPEKRLEDAAGESFVEYQFRMSLREDEQSRI
ncbi:15419_t:CDS:2 [Acaulospora colombiana]|uniref:15419_t:CDS:1 n=1 Tax=Acaulospora colombiana TaxID=27376 RepID=A0ACA9PIK8_9GLOM|nr:15419_t:CDS:2 [Acaulospora colombiana]